MYCGLLSGYGYNGTIPAEWITNKYNTQKYNYVLYRFTAI